MTHIPRREPLPGFLKRLMALLESTGSEELFLQGEKAHYWGPQGTWLCAAESFTEDWMQAAQFFAADAWQRLDLSHPTAGGSFSTGALYRWQAVLPPAGKEPLFTLRRHRFEQLECQHFAMEPDLLPRIEVALTEGVPIFVCGATGSGKSSFLNAVLKHFCLHERLFLLEDSRELQCQSPLWTSLSSVGHNDRYSLPQLFSSVLRLRPERIVIGELRGAELSVLLQALYSGHRGVLATVHVGREQDLLMRLLQLLPNYSYEALAQDLRGYVRIDLMCGRDGGVRRASLGENPGS